VFVSHLETLVQRQRIRGERKARVHVGDREIVELERGIARAEVRMRGGLVARVVRARETRECETRPSS
jgi:hypothetical protein